MNGIPREQALRLCEQIRKENGQKVLSLGRLQCWGCYKWSRGEVEKLCLASKEGCNLVNDRYRKLGDKEVGDAHQ